MSQDRPAKGGSYLRQKNGALKRREWTEPAPTRGGGAEAEAAAPSAAGEETAPPPAEPGKAVKEG